MTRWLSSDGSHFPRDEERILALAGALDIDPTALWTFDADTFPILWPKITRAARTGKWSELLTPLSFLRHFAEPADEWPSEPIAKRFFDRGWVVHEFSHDPQKGANSTRTSCFARMHRAVSSRSSGTLPFVTAAFTSASGSHSASSGAKPVTSRSSMTGGSRIRLAARYPTKRLTFRLGSGRERPPSAWHRCTRSRCPKPKRRGPGVPTVRFGFPGEVIANRAQIE